MLRGGGGGGQSPWLEIRSPHEAWGCAEGNCPRWGCAGLPRAGARQGGGHAEGRGSAGGGLRERRVAGVLADLAWRALGALSSWRTGQLGLDGCTERRAIHQRGPLHLTPRIHAQPDELPRDRTVYVVARSYIVRLRHAFVATLRLAWYNMFLPQEARGEGLEAGMAAMASTARPARASRQLGWARG